MNFKWKGAMKIKNIIIGIACFIASINSVALAENWVLLGHDDQMKIYLDVDSITTEPGSPYVDYTIKGVDSTGEDLLRFSSWFTPEPPYSYCIKYYKDGKLVCSYKPIVEGSNIDVINKIIDRITNKSNDTVLKNIYSNSLSYYDYLQKYKLKMKKDIINNWHPPYIIPPKNPVVQISIRDGHVINFDFIQSSGNKEVDNSIISAIKLLGPYEPRPAVYNSYGDGECPIFTFSYDSNLEEGPDVIKYSKMKQIK